MFSHLMIGANDIDASKAFYDAALGALGVRPGRVDPKGRVTYVHGGNIFMLTKPIDGGASSHGNGTTLGFTAETQDAADAFHAAGIAAGGTAIEDPPGPRMGILYLAYLRDPDPDPFFWSIAPCLPMSCLAALTSNAAAHSTMRR
jgi:catechol 2,3-dioxygenase-like lactoylglutathione lyase family enzyme